MKKLTSIVAALAVGLVASVAFAEGPPAGGDKGEAPGGMHRMMETRDCAKAPADRKERCEAHNKMLETCKAKPAGEERKKCVMENRPKKADK